MGTIFSTIGKKKPPDKFEKGMQHISYALLFVMLIVVTVIVLADYFASLDVTESILFGVSVASALTPQMLSLIVNTSLAKGALAMARHRCIVKSLTVMQDMGSMDILCIDKTGTLTTNNAIFVNYFDSWGSPHEKQTGVGRVAYDDSIEFDMVFLGIISFFDPPKDSAKQALWRLAEKGVKAKLLTGDCLSIAKRICKEVGIRTTHVITGANLELLYHESFHETIKRATVLGRLTPTHKLLVVQSLQTVGGLSWGFWVME